MGLKRPSTPPSLDQRGPRQPAGTPRARGLQRGLPDRDVIFRVVRFTPGSSRALPRGRQSSQRPRGPGRGTGIRPRIDHEVRCDVVRSPTPFREPRSRSPAPSLRREPRRGISSPIPYRERESRGYIRSRSRSAHLHTRGMEERNQHPRFSYAKG